MDTEEQTLEVTGALIKATGEIIYSRARHDFHYDETGSVAIDGGFDYVKTSFKSMDDFEFVTLRLKGVTKKMLYDDWYHMNSDDKYGSIHKDDADYTINEK